MKQLCRDMMKYFLPILFTAYMAGITLFTHAHVVGGATIVHSHPFKKGSTHEHTAVEFQLLHLLNEVLLTDSGLSPLSVIALFLLLAIFLTPPPRQPFCASCMGVVSLRAPPAL